MITEPSKSIEEIGVLLAQRPDYLAAVLSQRSYMPVAPLLEHSFATVQSCLKGAFAKAGLSSANVESISLHQLILYALAARELGVYWGTLALSWIESGFPVDEPLAVSLESLAKDKRFDQNARHRAFGIANKWRNSSIAGTSNQSESMTP